MPWTLWSPGTIKKTPTAGPANQQAWPGCVCARGRGQWGLVQLTIQHDSHGNRWGRVLVCWPVEGWEVQNQKLQRDCRFSAISSDPGKEEPDLTHTTCINPGHPTVGGQLIPGTGKGLGLGGKGVSFHLLKS